MPDDARDWYLVRKWRQLTSDWAPYVEDAIPGADLSQSMRRSSIPSFSFFLMLGLATLIATFGLIADSAPAIIGAMIIAPLMAPIISLSHGLIALEAQVIVRSAFNIFAGTILVMAIAYLCTLFLGLRLVGSEILSRTSPTLIDLGVAMGAGAAGAFSNTRLSIISSIAGVAIAVALVPPLAVAGIGLALGQSAASDTALSLSVFGLISGGRDIAAGAFLLFLTNLLGIVTCAILVFFWQRYGKWKPLRRHSWFALGSRHFCFNLCIAPFRGCTSGAKRFRRSPSLRPAGRTCSRARTGLRRSALPTETAFPT